MQIDRHVLDTEFQEAVWDLRFPEPAIESIDELVDVLLQPMGSDSAVVGSDQEALEIGDDNVDPAANRPSPLGR